MNEEEKEELQELINLLYNNHISQYGKRKLEKYIKEMQEEIEHLTEINNKYNDMKYFAMVADRYISKDKIKAKIEEYNKKCDECNFNKTGICKELKAHYNCSIQSVLELLKELIGETK